MRQKGHAITPVWEKQQLSDGEEIWSCLCFMQWFLNTKCLGSPGREIRSQVPVLSTRLLPLQCCCCAFSPLFLTFARLQPCSCAEGGFGHCPVTPKGILAFTASWTYLDQHHCSSRTLLAELRHSVSGALIFLTRQGFGDNSPGVRCTQSLHVSRCQSALLDLSLSPASGPAPHVHVQITALPCLSAGLGKSKDYKWLDPEGQVQWHKSKCLTWINVWLFKRDQFQLPPPSMLL